MKKNGGRKSRETVSLSQISVQFVLQARISEILSFIADSIYIVA
jgi:hypothetical protein